MEQDLVAERMRNFLGQHFPATRNVQDEQSLLGGGLIDSLGILEVVTFLEKEFGLVVSDEEPLPENFESVRSLSNFVQRKKTVSANGKGLKPGDYGRLTTGPQTTNRRRRTVDLRREL